MANNALPMAAAWPTKSFFVGMLVRDIELKDTLLDLLDNCVDGILRSSSPDLSKPTPYEGFGADIVIGANGFSIEDNCGGIPFEIARDSAFAIGKPKPIQGADAIATVGMYGIGMKRAIFKFGRDAVVESWHDRPFRVHIDKVWLADENWKELPMEDLPDNALPSKGTRISVTDLYPAIAAEFGLESFIDELVRTISENFSLIIAKGFKVTVRANREDAVPEAILPAPFSLLTAEADQSGAAIAPYVYTGTIGKVQVEIYAGLYRRLPDTDEQEKEEETTGSTEDAGWTIACNDRVVVWKDRSRLTGWGEATVPNWHGQFIAVSGIVLLHSDDPKRLPLTTTKRGIDAGSEIYSQIKDFMREATKGLTSFTNKWKKYPDDLDTLYLRSQELDLTELRRLPKKIAMKAVHKLPSIARSVPVLPVPPQIKTSSRISFVAANADVTKLALVYFGDARAKPRSVGEEAFQREVDLYSEAAE